MVNWLVKKILGNRNTREVRRLWPVVARINEIEQQYQALSDAELQAKTAEFKQRVAGGETLDDVLPEAFAAVKNTCRRMVGREWTVRGRPYRWDMVPFDVQLL